MRLTTEQREELRERVDIARRVKLIEADDTIIVGRQSSKELRTLHAVERQEKLLAEARYPRKHRRIR